MEELTPNDQMFLDITQDSDLWLSNLDALEQENFPEFEQRMVDAFIRLGRLLFTNTKAKKSVAEYKQEILLNPPLI